MSHCLAVSAQRTVLGRARRAVESPRSARAWTGALWLVGFGHRHGGRPPDAGALAGRAERTARKMVEHVVLLAPHSLQADSPAVAPVAKRLFWSRIVYASPSTALVCMRLVVRAAGVAGLGMMAILAR